MVDVKVCLRCEGCGWVGGIRGWERPLTRLVHSRAEQARLPSVLVPHPCGDCAGSGVTLRADRAQPRLPRAFLYGRGGASN